MVDWKPIALGAGGCFGFAFLIFMIVLLSSIKVVEINQQLLFKRSSGNYVKNGPFTAVVWPHERMERREASRIGQREYAVIREVRLQELRHHTEAGLVFLDAYEELVEVKQKLVLQKNEYIRLQDKFTGFERVLAGPRTLVPSVLEEFPAGVERCPVVGATNAILVENKTSGMLKLITARGQFVPAPYEHIVRMKEATLVDTREYAVVKDELTGKLRVEEGPKLLQVGPYDKVLRVTPKLVLEKDEYIRLVDKQTGEERIVVGPRTIVPSPQEITDGKQQAAFLTSQTAVIVLNKSDGQQRLETTPGVFIPQQYEKVVSMPSKIRVLAHQIAVTRDAFGKLTIHSDPSGSVSFFLEPYNSLVEMQWSKYDVPGVQEPVPTEKVTVIDMRVRKMFLQTEVRTSDNVKLRLEGTIFWRVADVTKLLGMTSDPPSDVAQRARSTLIQAVSRETLSGFMADFHNITAQASAKASSEVFYTERGVQLESLEVTNFEPIEAETAKVLQSIIAETTKRINEFEKAKSENEIASAKLLAEVAYETRRSELIRTKSSNVRLEAMTEGMSAGSKSLQKANAYIAGLENSVPNVTERVNMYKLNEQLKSRNMDTENLAKGKAQLFVTPDDLNLKLNMGPGSGT